MNKNFLFQISIIALLISPHFCVQGMKKELPIKIAETDKNLTSYREYQEAAEYLNGKLPQPEYGLDHIVTLIFMTESDNREDKREHAPMFQC
jgi:hypothetical protein